MQKVEDVKRPLKVGEKYLVPCLISEVSVRTYDPDPELDLIPVNIRKLVVNPIINHPHSDRENGQKEKHYHNDYRFLIHENGIVKNKDTRFLFGGTGRPNFTNKIQYLPMEVRNEDFYRGGITPVHLISKSKLKHKCIHKGKCPHRGFDLSQVHPRNGKITCPLHGLEFDEITHKLLNEPK